MKFYLSIAVYLLMAAVIGWGIVLMMTTGNPWLLIVSFLVYLIGLVRVGCLAH